MSLPTEIKAFIVDNYLFGDDDGFENDSSFIKAGIIDSTGIMHLVSFLQEKYAVAIEDEELIPDNLDSIIKITAFIERKKQEVLPVTGAIAA